MNELVFTNAGWPKVTHYQERSGEAGWPAFTAKWQTNLVATDGIASQGMTAGATFQK
jgi:peptide methionine sulfoxide reductase MsrB